MTAPWWGLRGQKFLILTTLDCWKRHFQKKNYVENYFHLLKSTNSTKNASQKCWRNIIWAEFFGSPYRSNPCTWAHETMHHVPKCMSYQRVFGGLVITGRAHCLCFSLHTHTHTYIYINIYILRSSYFCDIWALWYVKMYI